MYCIPLNSTNNQFCNDAVTIIYEGGFNLRCGYNVLHKEIQNVQLLSSSPTCLDAEPPVVLPRMGVPLQPLTGFGLGHPLEATDLLLQPTEGVALGEYLPPVTTDLVIKTVVVFL